MKFWSASLMLGICFGFLGLVGCGPSDGNLDNPRQGTITVASDESFKPLVNALTNAYEGIYPNTHFKLEYKPEQEAIRQLLMTVPGSFSRRGNSVKRKLSLLKSRKDHINFSTLQQMDWLWLQVRPIQTV